MLLTLSSSKSMFLTKIQAALSCCGRFRAIKHGQSLHSCLIRLGLLNKVFLVNNLLSMYVNCSYFHDAQRLFDEMPERNIISWTIMVSAYTNCGRPFEGLRLFDQMAESETEQPNEFLYSAVLKACGLVGNIELGRLIHQDIYRAELEFDTVLMNALLDMYVKCGNLRDAQQVFDEILCKNSTSWNSLILGYTKQGLMDEALNLLNRMPKPDLVSWNTIIAGLSHNCSPHALQYVSMMHEKGLKLDTFTLPCALKTCSHLGEFIMGRQIHCYIIKTGFESSSYNMTALVDMYSNCKLLNEARKIYDQYCMCCPSVTDSLALWNSMLSGYFANEYYAEALNLIAQIHLSGAYFDSYTFSIALKVCIYFQNLRLASQMHGLVVTSGYELDYIVGSILIDLYVKQGNISNALRLFARLLDKDVVAWSTLIAGCARLGFHTLALSLFSDMVVLGLEIDQFVISSILKVCSKLASFRTGKQIHAFSLKKGYESEEVIMTSLVDMYAKCGEIEDGLALFGCVSKTDTMSWTGIIVGCAQNGRADEAIRLLYEMKKSGVKPNEVTLLGVLSACRHAGLVEEAWTIFNSIKTEHGLAPSLEHYHCMVDLLGQSGCFNEAKQLISEMLFEPAKTMWCSLLVACGTHKNRELTNIIAERLLATSTKDASVYVMLSNVYAALGMWDSSSKVREAVRAVGMKEAGKSWIEISS